MQPIILWSNVCAPTHGTWCYGSCSHQKKAASSSEKRILFFICIKKFILSSSDGFHSVRHKNLWFALVFSPSLKVSFCFLSCYFSSPKSFSLKPEINCCTGMWDVQEYQAWTTGHIGPSLPALMLSVSCEASCKIMDFLRYGLREGLIPWFFFNVMTS